MRIVPSSEYRQKYQYRRLWVDIPRISCRTLFSVQYATLVSAVCSTGCLLCDRHLVACRARGVPVTYEVKLSKGVSDEATTRDFTPRRLYRDGPIVALCPISRHCCVRSQQSKQVWGTLSTISKIPKCRKYPAQHLLKHAGSWCSTTVRGGIPDSLHMHLSKAMFCRAYTPKWGI